MKCCIVCGWNYTGGTHHVKERKQHKRGHVEPYYGTVLYKEKDWCGPFLRIYREEDKVE